MDASIAGAAGVSSVARSLLQGAAAPATSNSSPPQSKIPVAIIPARGWSDQLPDKHLKRISGQSFVALAIQAALQSRLFEHKDILVTSESQRILDEARHLGVVGLQRPESLITAKLPEVIEHALISFEDRRPEKFVVIDPAFPFTSGADVSAVYDCLSSPLTQSATTATVSRFPVMVTARSGRRGVWRPSDRKKTLLGIGSVYAVRSEFFANFKTLISKKGNIHIIPKERAIKVSDAWDFLAASGYAPEIARLNGRQL